MCFAIVETKDILTYNLRFPKILLNIVQILFRKCTIQVVIQTIYYLTYLELNTLFMLKYIYVFTILISIFSGDSKKTIIIKNLCTEENKPFN